MRKLLGLTSMSRLAISGSLMNVSFASSYTQLSTALRGAATAATRQPRGAHTAHSTQQSTHPAVALQPSVLFRRFWISRAPS